MEVHLSRRTEQRLNHRIRELTPRTWGSSVQTCLDQVNRYLRGWYGYFRLCTEQGVRRFKRFVDFEISLEIKNSAFIAPPRSSQRNWNH